MINLFAESDSTSWPDALVLCVIVITGGWVMVNFFKQF